MYHKIEIEDIALMLSTCVRGDGLIIELPTIIRAFQENYNEAVDIVNSNNQIFPYDFQLIVPDFWHIAKGRAKMLTKEDANRLWESQVIAYQFGNEFLQRDYSIINDVSSGYPVAIFKVS